MAKLSKSCYCLPLRTGLLIWGYIGLIIIYVSLLRMLFTIQDILDKSHYYDPASFTELTLKFGTSLVHFLFYIVFLIALHKKSRGLLEFFNSYNVIVLIGLIVIISLYLPMKAYSLHYTIGVYVLKYIILNLIILGVLILFQLYLIVAVRSLISELEDDKDCSSAVYRSEDPECIIHVYKEKDYLDC